MKHLFVTAPLVLSTVFLVFMVLAAPRGQLLGTQTVPTPKLIVDRFTHFHYTGHAVCDLARMIGQCGDVGSLTSR